MNDISKTTTKIPSNEQTTYHVAIENVLSYCFHVGYRLNCREPSSSSSGVQTFPHIRFEVIALVLCK